MQNNQIAKFFLRFGLAFVYIYASIEIHLAPANFLKYIPASIASIMPTDLFLPIFSIAEVLLAVWLS